VPSYTGDQQITLKTNTEYYYDNYFGFCCKAIQLPTTPQAPLKVIVFNTTVTGSDKGCKFLIFF